MEVLTAGEDLKVGDSFVIGVISPVIYTILSIDVTTNRKLCFWLKSNIDNVTGIVSYHPSETLFKIV